MAQGIPAGSIYYTVGIDRASLQRVRSEIQQLGKAAGQTGGGSTKAASALQKLSDRSRELANRLRTLQSEMKEQGGTSEQYRAGFEKVHNEAIQLRGALQGLESGIGSTAAEQAAFHGVMARTASVLQKSAAVTGSARTQYDALGAGFEKIKFESDRLASSLVQLEHRHDAGKVTTSEYAAQLNSIRQAAEGYENKLVELRNSLNLTDTEYRELTKTMQRFTGMQARAGKSATKATGKFNSMATATKLSYGATTLLNDRIFQLSPALGILTNQLIFTTEGLKAFLRAAAPIVAVGGAIVGTILGIVRALKSGVSLESSLADVRKTTNLADDELRQITTTFQELSHEIPVTVDEMLETARVAGQLGIRGTENIEQFTEAISKLGVATDVTGEQGATSLARFLSATDTALEDMGNEAIRVSNILNELENTTAATASEILQMTTFTQGLGAQAGFSRAEILGMNAALRSVGVRPQAGSAVLRTISDIQTAASEGGEALEAFAEASSVSFEEFERLARESPVDAFMALAEGMNASAREGANLNDILAEIGVVEVRERRALLGLVEGYERLEGAMSTARAQAILQNSIQEEVIIQSGTVEAKLRLLGNRFVTMSQNIGESLNPRLEDLVDTLIVLTDNLDLLAGALTGSLLALSGRSIISGIAALAPKLSALARTIGTVTTTLWGMQYALLALRTSLTALISGPFAIGVLGAAIGVGFVRFVRQGEEAVWDADEALEDYTERTRNAIQIFEQVRTKNDLRIAMEAVSETLTGPGRDAWDKYKDKIIENIEKVEDLEGATKDVIANFLDIDLSSFESRFTSTMNTLAETVTRATTGPLREELSGLNLDPENLEGTLRSVRQLQEDMSSRSLVPGRVGTLTRDEVEALQDLESGLLAAIEARNALREANEEYQTSLELLGLGDGTGADDDGDGGLPDVDKYRERYTEIGLAKQEALRLIERNFSQGLIESEEEYHRQRLSVYERMINDYNELYLEIQSVQGGGPELNNLQYTVGVQAESEMHELREIRDFLEGLRQDPVDPLTISNAETAEELFRALEEQGTKLAGAPPALLVESLEARRGLIQDALRRALDLEDITNEEVEYLKNRLEELDVRIEVETSVAEDEEEPLHFGRDKSSQARAEAADRMRDTAEATYEAVSAVRDMNAVLSWLRENQPTEEQEAFNESLEESREEVENLERRYRLGLIEQHDVLSGKISETKDLIDLASVAFGENSSEVGYLTNHLSDLENQLGALENPPDLSFGADKSAQAQAEATDRIREQAEATHEAVSAAQDMSAVLSWLRNNQPTAEQEEYNDAIEEHAELINDLSDRVYEGLISEEEALQEEIESKNALLLLAVDLFGRTSSQAEALRLDIKGLNEELEALQPQDLSFGADRSAQAQAEVADRMRERAEATYMAVEAVKDMNAVLSWLRENEPTDEQREYTEAVQEHGETVSELESKVRLGLIPAQDALEDKLESTENLLYLAAEAFGENSVQVAELEEKIKELREALGAGEMTAFERETRNASEGIYDFRQRVLEASDDAREAMANLSFDGGLSGTINSLGTVIESVDEILGRFTQDQIESSEVLSELAAAVEEARGELEGLEEVERIVNVFDGLASTSSGLVKQLGEFASAAATGMGDVLAGAKAMGEGFDLSSDKGQEAAGNITSGITSILGGLNELLPQYDSTANQMVEGAFAAAGAIAEIAIPIPGIGQAISALGSVVSSVFGDMSNGAKQVKESLEEAAESAELLTDATVQSFKEIEGVVERVSRGNVLGWLGFKKDELQQEMFDMVMGIAEGVASGLQSALSSAIDAALSGEQNWKQAFRENFEDAILDVIMDTFIKAAILASGFQSFIEEFTKISAEEGPEAAFEYFEEEFENVMANAERVVDEAMRYIPDRFKEGWDEAVEATGDNVNRILDKVTEAGSIVNRVIALHFVTAATEDGVIDQAMVERMVSLAEGVAGGMEQGLRQGINSFLRGDDDWAQQLEDGITSAVTNALINAFIASSAVQGIMADFVRGFVLAFEESPKAAAEYARENIADTINQMKSMVSTFVENIPDELLPSSNRRSTRYRPPKRDRTPAPEPDPRAAGTNISEITGPTRDLLTDLLRPLSIMPSWTSMIRDIRNDVRMIATNGGMGVPQIQATPSAMRTGITNNTVNIQNATITTQATDAKGLWRAISRYSFKERRGGK